jgi:mannose-6-phosphate isomerase-like protein (cupin superfamily)
MELSGRTLSDPRGRGSVTFAVTAADSAARVLSTLSVLRPGFPLVPLHVHPHQHERFLVRRGRLRVTVGRRRHVLGPGDELVVPPGTPHTFAVAGEEVEVQVDFSPAGDMEGFLEGLWALSLRRPRLREVAALGRRHFADVRLALVPAAAQRALLALLAGPEGRERAEGCGHPHVHPRGGHPDEAGSPPRRRPAPGGGSAHDPRSPSTGFPGVLRGVRRPRGRDAAHVAPPPRWRAPAPHPPAPAPAPPPVMG